MLTKTRRALLVLVLPFVALLPRPGTSLEAAPRGPEQEQVLYARSAGLATLFTSLETTTSTTVAPPPAPTTTTTAPPPPPPPPPPAPTPPPAPAPAPSSGNCAGWEATIAVYFPADQVAKACSVMMCETGGTGDPTIYNSSGSGASGMWQFMPQTWESTTGTPAPAANYSADTQTSAAAHLWASSGWSQWSCA